MLGSWVQAGTQQTKLCIVCYDLHPLSTPGCKPVAGVHGYHKTAITFSPVLPPSTIQEGRQGDPSKFCIRELWCHPVLTSTVSSLI